VLQDNLIKHPERRQGTCITWVEGWEVDRVYTCGVGSGQETSYERLYKIISIESYKFKNVQYSEEEGDLNILLKINERCLVWFV
jgi:hypothetical protein